MEDFVPEIMNSYEPTPDNKPFMISEGAWNAMSDAERGNLTNIRERFPKLAVFDFLPPSQEAQEALKDMGRLVDIEIFPEIIPHTVVDSWIIADTPLKPSPDAVSTAWGTSVSTLAGAPKIVEAKPACGPSPKPLQGPRRSLRSTSTKSEKEEPAKGGKMVHKVKKEGSGIFIFNAHSKSGSPLA
ncbi:hypothetical protein H0H87_012328 [Tephrocybe sp. NHM501043]|nr:hypothetical protein H0H87_012328 [Tephrocybe sp. NHM501043]